MKNKILCFFLFPFLMVGCATVQPEGQTTRWEYNLESHVRPDSPQAEARLNRHGDQGWTAVSTSVLEDGRMVVLFKRPKEE